MSNIKDNSTFNYKEYLESIQAKYKTPDSIIEAAIEKGINQSVKGKQRIIMGEASEVYDITTNTDLHIIMRISRDFHNPYKKEKWALAQCTKKGIPVPTMLSILEFTEGTKPLYICLENKLPGSVLSEAEFDKNDPIYKKIIIESGKLLAKVHSIPAGHFGYSDENGENEPKTFRPYIKNKFKSIKPYEAAAQKNNVDTKKISESFQVLDRYIPLFDSETPILVHNDYGPRHILVNGGKISGIIDFGNCKGGFPEQDFAWCYFWDNDSHSIELMKQGYKTITKLRKDFDLRFHIAKLYTSLDLLNYCDSMNHLSGIANAKKNIDESLNYLKSL